jgi:hypothetical protein
MDGTLSGLAAAAITCPGCGTNGEAPALIRSRAADFFRPIPPGFPGALRLRFPPVGGRFTAPPPRRTRASHPKANVKNTP